MPVSLPSSHLRYTAHCMSPGLKRTADDSPDTVNTEAAAWESPSKQPRLTGAPGSSAPEPRRSSGAVVRGQGPGPAAVQVPPSKPAAVIAAALRPAAMKGAVASAVSVSSAAGAGAAVEPKVASSPAMVRGQGPGPKQQQLPAGPATLKPAAAAAAVPAVTAAAPAAAASNGAAQGSVKLSAVEEIRAQLAALEAKVEADRQRTVVVKGLPPNVTEKNLATFFQ